MADIQFEDDRSIELSSIAAIYPEIKIDPENPFKATLELPVTLPSPTRVCFQQPVDIGPPPTLTPPTSVDGFKADLGQNVARDVHILSHLPPLNLSIELPEGYPTEKPPIVRLTTHPLWLPPTVLTRLIDDCARLWEECGQDMVVYTYIDHLQQSAELAFGIQDTTDGELCLSRDLKIALLDFNSKAEREKFEQETFECGVCLEPKKGATCHRLLRCSHVFCVPCLQDFYNTCIAEGDVDSVRCLAPDCEASLSPTIVPGDGQTPRRKKRDRTLGPSELLEIPLSTETVQRYVFLKRKKKIESDKTTVYCPRQWCQGAARSKRHPKPTDPMAEADDAEGSDEEEEVTFDPLGEKGELPPVAERVAICEECNYAFCSVCRKGWHGELVMCLPQRKVDELSAEEKATQEYMRLYTSQCPTCTVPCQKRMGCNHMRCFQCDTHFCYLCSAWLSPDNPYSHFNQTSSTCYNRLWDLEGGDGLDPEGAEALHQIPEALLVFDDEDHDRAPPEVGIGVETETEWSSSDEDDDRPEWDFDFSDDDQARQLRPPPPAPVPPRVPGVNHPGPDAAARAAMEREEQARAMAEIRNRNRNRPARRAEQARNGPLQEPRGMIGLQRFLELVQNDREDEWDSDELEDF
ncbi:E3 ubiquitin-protein ligase itt1 [Penicillium rolfsii]|nr:E3 ubiquitin-protein ligase itt1 [Penicillium rolfsii]